MGTGMGWRSREWEVGDGMENWDGDGDMGNGKLGGMGDGEKEVFDREWG